MSEKIDVSGYHRQTLSRLQAAADELTACLDDAHAFRPFFRQFSEILSLWDALPTDESRESALVALRDVSARYRL